MCEITTAGRLQVQISFPSASLLIKQLNGQKKVVLRVKSVKEKGKDVRAHTQTRHVLELDPEIQYLAFRLTDIPKQFSQIDFWCNHYVQTHVNICAAAEISAKLFTQLCVSVI